MKGLVAEPTAIEQELAKDERKEKLKELLKTQGLVELDEKQCQVVLHRGRQRASGGDC